MRANAFTYFRLTIKKLLIFIPFFLFCPLLYASGQVYLDCKSYNQPSGRWDVYNISLNEGGGKAAISGSWSLMEGKTYTVPANFSQTEVSFTWAEPTFGFSFLYKINRENLDFSKTSISGTGIVDRGSCNISEAVNRKF